MFKTNKRKKNTAKHVEIDGDDDDAGDDSVIMEDDILIDTSDDNGAKGRNRLRKRREAP